MILPSLLEGGGKNRDILVFCVTHRSPTDIVTELLVVMDEEFCEKG
jgi:hypothetical protein